MQRWRTGRSSCRRALRKLQTYLDEEADSDISWRVARHLSRCEDCFADADALRAIKEAVARLRIAPGDEVLVRLRRLLDGFTDPSANR